MASRSDSRIPWRLLGWLIPVVLLAIPLVAMQFTEEVDWQLPDFILMGTLMGIVGGGIELAFRLSGNCRYRVAAVLALLAGFLMTWVNMAVGIVGDGELPMELPYFLVLLGGLVGAVGCRFKAAALAITLYWMVVGLIVIAAVVLWTGSLPDDTSPKDLIGITGFFSTLFLIPALLFRQAARDEAASLE